MEDSRSIFFWAKHLLEEVRRSVRNLWLVANISFRRHADAEANDSFHAIERTEMLASDSDAVHRGEPSCLPPRRGAEFCSQPPGELGRTLLGRQGSAQIEKGPDLHASVDRALPSVTRKRNFGLKQ